MYQLVLTKNVTMEELKTVYTLDEALKLEALVNMRNDLQSGMNYDALHKNK